MAFIYDLFRIKRKAIRTRNIVIYIEDFFFWIIVALVMFFVVYLSNEGELRGYIMIGTILGVVLYILLLSSIVIKWSLIIIRTVCMIIKKVWMIATYPIRIILRILGIPAKFFGRKFMKLFRGIRRASKNRIANMKIRRRIFRNSRKMM